MPEPATHVPDHVPEHLTHKLREAAAVVLLALTLNLAGNSRTSLWDRDEPRYATCTREMRARGDLIRPTFNGEPRYQKPILIYWLMLGGTAIGGDTPYGARLVSAVAGAVACLLIWSLAKRMLGRRTGFLAALMLTTAPLMVIESKLATTDATLALFLIGCQHALWELSHKPSHLSAMIFWICLALATLTKGPVGLGLVAAMGLVSWWCGGPTACWKRLEWRRGLPIFACLTLPWYLAIGILSRGAFYREALGFQILQRITTGIEEHGAFPGYYVVTSLLTLHPWSALLPAALLGAWVKRKSNPAMGFLLGWAIGPLILLECMRTKMVHYYLPAVPACAMLTAWLLSRVTEAEINLRRWPLGRICLGLLAGVAIGLTVTLLAGVMVLPWALRWPSLVVAIVIGGGTLLAIEQFYASRTEAAARYLVATWALALFIGGSWLLPAAEPYRISRRVGERLAILAEHEQALPMLVTFQQPSVIYALGRHAFAFQDKASFFRRVQREGAVVTALTPHEVNCLSADSRGVIEARETIHGFNIDKGRNEVLQLVVVRPAAGLTRLAGRSQKALVK